MVAERGNGIYDQAFDKSDRESFMMKSIGKKGFSWNSCIVWTHHHYFCIGIVLLPFCLKPWFWVKINTSFSWLLKFTFGSLCAIRLFVSRKRSWGSILAAFSFAVISMLPIDTFFCCCKRRQMLPNEPKAEPEASTFSFFDFPYLLAAATCQH